jgi:hypothetical protein
LPTWVYELHWSDKTRSYSGGEWNGPRWKII